MLLIPAIDLKDGHCVRLKQGAMDDATVFSEDPGAMARHWINQGARRLHLVDLNGAFAGKPKNEPAIKAILAAVRAVAREAPDTRVSLFSEYLGDVEVRAHATHADLAIAVVPFAHPIGPARPLPPIDSVLVVAASHPLASLAAEAADGAAWLAELARHPLLTVRGSDPRLGLLPADFKPFAELRLPDFAAKREALLAAMGWGWMPRSRVAEGLADASLVHLTPPEASGLDAGRHAVIPRLHVRHDNLEGRASRAFVAGLTHGLS